ncbi:hypothetical protein [Mesorhizobium sp. CAU 1741]|uniref:hypothetical protein n=1 Tax=Mesorhizobium sp. CAU 1741 TaxID=3140366 RepID=UPI00325BE022
MTALMHLAARHGRALLILGLVLGIALPGLALVMRDWIPETIAALLFFAALRIGPRAAMGAMADVGSTLGVLAITQLAFPLLLTMAFLAAGWTGPLAMGLILMAAAAPISGSPSITIMTGNDPAPALRVMIFGTALLPLTVIPVFWLLPALDGGGAVLLAAGRLLLVIAIAVACGFLVRAFVMRDPGPDAIKSIDGVSAILLGVVVIGLMSAVGPAITADPVGLAINLAVAFAVNFVLQIATTAALRRAGRDRVAVPYGIVTGNRNIGIFLTALPLSVTDPLLLFIGCYQIPMYLTPMLLGRFYAARHA